MAAAADSLKKPSSAYWLWLGDNREKIAAEVGSLKGSVVAKKAGEMWKALADDAKAPYEKKAKEQKDAYEKFIATDEGKKALEEKKAAKNDAKADGDGKTKAERKNERACKAELKAIAKDKNENLKKPTSAYWMWLNDNRSKIAETVGAGGVSEVAKKGGEMWKALSEDEKEPYEKKAKEQKEAYDKYIASEEGAAALKAFKDATKAAKDQYKKKSEDTKDQKGTPTKEAKAGRGRGKADNKRKAEDQKVTPTKVAKTTRGKGRGRGKAETEPSVKLPESLVAQADKAGYTGNLLKLAAREDVIASGKSHAEIFKALEESQGLLHPARRALLGA